MGKERDEMIRKKEWDEFRDTGLLLFINQILHVFGWAIVFERTETETVNVYPARVKFRGFDSNSVSESYQKISDYLKDNIDDLHKETNE